MKKIRLILTITVFMIIGAGIIQMPVYSDSATSMDVNDFDSEMSIGSSQVINVVLYPEDADDEIKYSSSNTSVATISPGGKIEAKAAGTTTITVSAGSINETLTLDVVAPTMDINDFENKMGVGDSQTISVVLYPDNGKTEIKYSSSDTSVATISSGGKIEAKAAGTTQITVTAEGASKTLDLTVIVATKGITLNSTYITLRRGEKYKLKAKVTPSDAEQSLTFKSSNKAVAKVSKKGVIKAVGLGSTSIIVSNGDLVASADVIVNSGTSGSGTMYFGYDETDQSEGEDDTEAEQDVSSVNTKKLKTLMKTGNAMTIEKDDYEIILEGSDIVNCVNDLNGELHVVKNEDGYTFSVGGGSDFLPGEVTVRFKQPEMKKCRYVYLKDKSNDKMQMFGELKDGEFRTDIAGTYRITYEKLKGSGPNKKIIVALAAGIIAIGGLYILLKRIILF